MKTRIPKIPTRLDSLEWGQPVGFFDQIEIDSDEMALLIEQNGTPCEVHPSIRCPCSGVEGGSPDSSCLACLGMGWAYPKDERLEMPVMVQRRQPQQKVGQAVGDHVVGMVRFMFPDVPGFEITQGLRVWPIGETFEVQQVLHRAELLVDPSAVAHEFTNLDQVRPRNVLRDERILYPSNVEISRIVWLDGGELRTANRGDYTLKNGVIEWGARRGPAAGQAYTVRYQAPACYQLVPFAPVARGRGGEFFPMVYEAKRVDSWFAQQYGGDFGHV